MKNKKTSHQQESKIESNISKRKIQNQLNHIPLKSETFCDKTYVDNNQTENFDQDKPFISQIKEKITHFIGHLNEAPTFCVNNGFILTGYRINFSTSKKVLKRYDL